MCNILRPSNIALLLMLGGIAQVSAQPAAFRPQRDALQAGQALVETAARGEIDAAFAQAAELSRPGDSAALARLEAQKRVASQSAVGSAGALSLPQEMFFAGCITRTYSLRDRTGHRQQWMLKFRRGVAGWYLSDLNLRAS